MKRHSLMPEGIKHRRAAPPDKTWTGMYSPKRERRLEWREYERLARIAEIGATAALKRGAEEKARQLLELASAMKAKALSLLGWGADRRTNRALRRTAG